MYKSKRTKHQDTVRFFDKRIGKEYRNSILLKWSIPLNYLYTIKRQNNNQ